MGAEFIIDSNGVERMLANLTPPAGYVCRSFPLYGDTADTPMIPRSQWPALIAAMGNPFESDYLSPTHDQQDVGQCNADATTSMAESARMKQGLPLVMLSAADLYHQVNRGRDEGSLLEDAMAAMLKAGVGTRETSGAVWKRTHKPAPAAERKRFRFLEVFVAPTFDHFMSGLIAGFDGNTGIMWGNNYEPDGDGWLPETPTGGGGHSLHSYKPAVRQGRGGVQFGCATKNSWADRWGVKGRCIIPENAYRGPVGGWFLVRAITDEGGVVPPESK